MTVQRFLAKYGLAAHLAIVAVAPLFLFPFYSAHDVARALLWLTLFAAAWTLLGPSMRGGEALHSARARVARAVLRDPFFWLSLVVVAFAGLRALNGGVRMAYDAEQSVWSLASPAVAELPGCVDGAGFLPFAAALALSVVVTALRQALGRGGRAAFVAMSSAGAGLAAVAALVAAFEGHGGCQRAFVFPNAGSSYFGCACGVYFLAGTAALASGFERRWAAALAASPLSVGGTAAGAFAFSPPAMSAAFAVAGLLVLLWAFAYSRRALRGTGAYRLLAVFGIAVALGGLAVAFLAPDAAAARVGAFAARAFVPEGLLEARAALSDVALRVWRSAPWLGTGLGSFPLDIRFYALAEERELIPPGAESVPNGALLALSERGIVGAALVALPFAYLLVAYVCRLAAWAKSARLPHPAAGLAVAVFVVLAAGVPFDASLARADVLLAAGAVMAVSARSFPSQETMPNV